MLREVSNWIRLKISGRKPRTTLGHRRDPGQRLSVIEPLEQRLPLSPDVVNLGLAADVLQISEGYREQMDGDLLAFTVREYDQGQLDLNGDGDLHDHVLHVFDAGTGTTTNLELATYDVRVDGSLVAFAASERDNGNVDLNADGDSYDIVLHVYDASSGTLTNLGFSSERYFALDGDRLAFLVTESGQGNTDFNGDGDAADHVLHLFDAASGATTNMQLDSRYVQLDTSILAMNVRESAQGGADLNGDGDALDEVLHVIDLVSGTTTNLAVVPTSNFQLDGNQLYFQLKEDVQGDLNGDGDTADIVPQIYDAVSGTTTNLGLAGTSGIFDDNLLVFRVSEADQGNTDLNGDGDTTDWVLHVHDTGSGTTANFGIDALRTKFEGGQIWMVVRETDQEQDLNGDGDMVDLVVHVADPRAGTVANLGLAGSVEAGSELGVIEVREDSQGNTDLNGDGDTEDQVFHVYDASTGTTTNTRLAGFSNVVGTDFAVLSVVERKQGGTDLNGDGDLTDGVAHVFDVSSGEITNLGLSIADHNDQYYFFQMEGNRLIFLVPERDQGGTDLNGDGDGWDWVMHVADFSTPQTVPEQIDDITVEVQELNDAGILNNGQTNPLLNHLKNALKEYNKGKISKAVKKLDDFIDRVEDLLDDDVLTDAEAQPLIDAAQSLIDEILVL
jgi:hypothetical protein